MKYASNDRVDSEILAYLKIRKKCGANNLMIASEILQILTLPAAHPKPLWNAQEHVSRSCQRLRKRGLIRYENPAWMAV